MTQIDLFYSSLNIHARDIHPGFKLPHIVLGFQTGGKKEIDMISVHWLDCKYHHVIGGARGVSEVNWTHYMVCSMSVEMRCCALT